jgi:hypothetical protein
MAERINLSEKERDAALREAGYRCAVPTCNTTLAMDVHHIVWVKDGGGNELTNLLALCPTCHALYHRKEITQESIEHWKARLVALNRSVDVQAELDKRVQEIQSQKKQEGNKGEQREGFALAASEFSLRTCEVGFVYGQKRFVKTGYCCFVAPKLAVTTATVVDWASEIGAARGGSPAIATQRGLAPFTIRERFDLGSIVLVEIGKIDDQHMIELLKDHDEDFARYFQEPLQTPVRFSIGAFQGDRVGFLHASENSNQYRSPRSFQFDSADVAFYLNTKSEEDFLQYVLSPILSHVQHRGSPVFTEDGRLVGILRETIQFEGEDNWRPVVSPALPLGKILSRKK